MSNSTIPPLRGHLRHRRKLLLCLDAFGTLIRPKRPIAAQYADLFRRRAAAAGLRDGMDYDLDGLGASFRAAYKEQAKRSPNYGNRSGMGPQSWWMEVINNTLQPHMRNGHAIPAGLGGDLWRHFSSRDGYELVDAGIAASLAALRGQCDPKAVTAGAGGSPTRYDEVVVGVVTNSDGRVPGVLASLGLAVGAAGTEAVRPPPTPEEAEAKGVAERLQDGEGAGRSRRRRLDVDFHCISYSIGAMKPRREIFKAAESTARRLSRGDICGDDGGDDDERQTPPSASCWDCVHIGDDYEADVAGALGSGWAAVLVQRDGDSALAEAVGMAWLERQPWSVGQFFGERRAVRVRTATEAVDWFTRAIAAGGDGDSGISL